MLLPCQDVALSLASCTWIQLCTQPALFAQHLCPEVTQLVALGLLGTQHIQQLSAYPYPVPQPGVVGRVQGEGQVIAVGLFSCPLKEPMNTLAHHS